MSWREKVEQALQGEDSRDDRDARGANVSSVPSVPGPLDALRSWRAALSTLDPEQPTGDIDPKRWRSLVKSAAWVVWHYGEQAARNGWTTADLFGLWPDKPGWGGLVDRMGSARNLKLCDKTANWRPLFGPAEKFHRGGYPDLKAFWEAE